jgi:alkylation response protein AidB-like acyl-CoA dehydrogenase
VRFAPTEEQELLRASVRELLARRCPPAAVRAAWRDGWSRERWRALGDAGIVTMLREGQTEVELVIALEEAGAAALPEPLLETAMLAVPLLGDRLPAGATATVGPLVFDADLFLLEDDRGLHALPRAAVTLAPVASVDGARRLHRVTWRAADGQRLGGPELAAEVRDRGALGAAAVLVGLGRRMLEQTVAYVKVRQQFGRAIGSFQAVKHHLAGALVGLELAAPAVTRAAAATARREPERAVRIAMAKALASEAALGVARAALQCHGAIGYAFEHDLHLWMKRTWALAAEWGDAAWHRARVAGAILDDGLELEMGGS